MPGCRHRTYDFNHPTVYCVLCGRKVNPKAKRGECGFRHKGVSVSIFVLIAKIAQLVFKIDFQGPYCGDCGKPYIK